MKQWTTPDIEELNINETENGFAPTGTEEWPIQNVATSWGEAADNWFNGVS